MNRWSSRAGFGTLIVSGLCGLYVGCSDDPVGPGPQNDAGGDVLAPVDTGVVTPEDAGNSCPDEPFDCSKTAANTNVDDAGPSSGEGLAGQVPIHLRCTSLYSCWSTKTIAADHREYAPAFVLWSDGAEKTRWVMLPPNTTIDTGTTSGADVADAGSPDEWIYPIGTMVFKEFKLGTKRIETRRIWKASATEWVYSVWRWSDDESTATLTNEGGLVPNTVHPGRVYEIPKTSVCKDCHDGHRDKFLSLDAWSLGAGATGVTLASLKAEGRLPSWSYPTTFAVPQDGTGLFDKAVGFYYNNCGFCHKPGRPAGGSPNALQLYLPVAEALPGANGGDGGLPDGGAGLRPEATPIYRTAVGVLHTNPVGGMFPLDTYKRITPGNAGLSVLPGRDSLRDTDGGTTIVPGQMPNILQRTFDSQAVEATRAWINALPPP